MTRSNVPAPETAPPIPPSGLAASAAELPADVLAAIEREMRTRVSDVPPELVRHAVAVSKKAGNDAFAAKRFADAARFYTQAIAGAPDDKALRSNRSAAYLALGRTEEAVADGVRCVALDARWPKAHYRLGKALAAAGEWHAAASSLETCARLMTGVGLDEKNTKHDGVSRDVSEDSEDTSTKEDTHKRLSVTDAEDAGKKIYVNDSTPNARDAATLDGVLELLAVAQAESEDARGRMVAHELSRRRAFASRLRAARRADDREATLMRWKQTMSGPDWDVEDQEWRPTFAQNARLSVLNKSAFAKDPRRAGVLAHFKNLAELAAPKLSLQALDDEERTRAYARAAKRLVAKAKKDERDVVALCLSGGGPGVLPLCAAAAGAARVFSVERGPFSFRAARGVCRANEARGVVRPNTITVLDRPIDQVDPTDDKLRGALADVVLLDVLDRAGGLGMRLLRSIDQVARKGLASRDALVSPKRLRTFACLAQIKIESVRGLDLRLMNAYRWHPQAARFDPTREPHVVLSDAFEVFDIDLEARLRANFDARREEDGEEKTEKTRGIDRSGAASWDEDFTLSVPITKDGAFNAVVFWFEADMGHSGDVLRSAEPPPKMRFPFSQIPSPEIPSPSEASEMLKVHRNVFTATSWGLAAQYLDEVFVRRGETVSLRVRRDDDQVLFASAASASTPRTATIPTWHYDMLNDAGRNEAYDNAITCAVRRVKGLRVNGETETLGAAVSTKDESSGNDSSAPETPPTTRPCSVIDAGSGSCLLAMFAARAGADFVTAIERSAHMTDVGEEIACVNGFAGKIHCLHRDARHVLTRESLPGLPLNGVLKPDGVPTEMQAKADLMVYEIFDSGLIGEGALHVIAAARARLLREKHVLVPARARMFAQLIEARFGETSLVELGGFASDEREVGSVDDDRDVVDSSSSSSSFEFDFSHANRWRWREEYEGVDLESAANAKKWRPLSAPFPFFEFDFYDVSPSTLAPEEKRVRAPIIEDGTCNAVAFWFELELGTDANGDAITLSTSPYDGTKGQTWQQAVQYLEEFVVKSGDAAPLVARHDTYGVSFQVDDADGAFETFASRRKNAKHAPSHDPAWGAAFAAAKKIDHALANALTQNPLEYRAVAEVAVAAGARPADLGLEAEQGAELCVKYMG
jgi:predicted RNA methylase